MARLFIGRKTSGGGGLVRVMKNNTDNPNTTPSSQVDKFLFDSETQDLGYAVKTYVAPLGVGQGYFPAGSNINNCLFMRDGPADKAWFYFWPNRFLSGYPYPIGIDAHGHVPGTNQYEIYYAYVNTTSRSSYAYGEYSNAYFGGILNTPWELYIGFEGQTRTAPPPYNRNYNYTGEGSGAKLQFDGMRYNCWTIPASNYNFDPPSAPPAAGQKNVIISPSQVKVSRPGFDVATATGRQLIADSDHIPAKLLRSGSIAAIGAGSFVDVPVGFNIPANTFIDAQFSDYDLADFLIPGDKAGMIGAEDAYLQVRYEIINGNTVRFHNAGEYQVKGRYMIFASGDGQTTGQGPVLRTIPEQNPQYCQLIRPGASANPHWDDTILDTRASYLPLVATGYIPNANFVGSDDGNKGEVMATIAPAIPAGYVPYVKAWFYHIRTSLDLHQFETPAIHRFWDFDSRIPLIPGEKQNVVLIRSNNSITFYTMRTGISDRDEDGWHTRDTRFQGVVFHIFAVPDSF